MKYRRLTKEELIPLEKEFVQFLASNQITAEDWEDFKQIDPSAADALLDLFSDVVFDKILNDVNYIEVRDENSIKEFKFGEEKAEMIGLRFDSKISSSDITIEAILNNAETNHIPVSIIVAEKSLDSHRNEEKFVLLQSGGTIQKDSSAFDQLLRIKAESKAKSN